MREARGSRADTETDEIAKEKDVEQLCPYYLDIQGEQQRLQASSLHSPMSTSSMETPSGNHSIDKAWQSLLKAPLPLLRDNQYNPRPFCLLDLEMPKSTSLDIVSRPCLVQVAAADFLTHLNGMQALVDKLKSIDSCITLITTKQAFLYLQVSAPGVQVASEVQNLELVPHDALETAQAP